jgi:hypothetical protein
MGGKMIRGCIILPSLILLVLPLCAFVPLCEILRIDEQHTRINDSLGEAMSLNQPFRTGFLEAWLQCPMGVEVLRTTQLSWIARRNGVRLCS